MPPPNPWQIAQPDNDVWGILVIISGMIKDTAATFPDYHGAFAIGGNILLAPLKTFTWGGIHWTPAIILGRLMWVGVAILLSLVASLIFSRFDPTFKKPVRSRQITRLEPVEAKDNQTSGIVDLSPWHRWLCGKSSYILYSPC